MQAAILLGLTAGAGAAARRVPLARPLTAGAQLITGVLLLTLLFAREEAFLWFLPSPDAVRELGTLIGNGVGDVGRFTSPAPLTDGIALLLVGGVLLVGLLVDTFAVTYRLAAPAGLPLLALYSVAAGLSDGGAGALWFALAGAGYLVLLLAESRDRLAQWGRVFGGPARGGFAPRESVGTPTAPMRSGRRIGAVALGLALVVPLVLPSLGAGLLGGTGPRPGGGSGGGGTISAVNPLVSLQNSLNQPENREVLKYRTNAADTDDLYLRIVSLDEFDGTSWKPASRNVSEVPERLPPPPGLAAEVPFTEVSTNISAAAGTPRTGCRCRTRRPGSRCRATGGSSRSTGPWWATAPRTPGASSTPSTASWCAPAPNSSPSRTRRRPPRPCPTSSPRSPTPSRPWSSAPPAR
ncbi:DUF3488 domain-containing protein [Actinomadura keratinilytica]